MPSSLFLRAIATTLCLLVRPAAASDISSLLLAKTQAFSDAGQQGNIAVMKDLLDDNVVFFNENGERATKADLVSGGAPPNTGITVKMTVTDWDCQVNGNVAVASFIDDQVQDLHGQIFHAQFRSVETWLQQGGTWRMIGSQTIALQSDPPAIAVPLQTLSQYVGTYQAAPSLRVTFARNGGDLTASVNGGPPSAQQAELPDVFFTPGHPRVRKIFQRDANGTVTGFLSRREGHDILFKRIAQG